MNLQFQEFYMQPWTYTSEFSRMNDGLFVYINYVCVKCNYLTIDYPLTLSMPVCVGGGGGVAAIVERCCRELHSELPTVTVPSPFNGS